MALSGIRVLDLSHLAPGPYATMLLADLGADVLVIEPVGEPVTPEDKRKAAYFALGRNKRALRLNLKHDEGRSIFRRLARDADVVLEQFRPGVVERLGIDYETLRGENPRLVYCSLTGFGQTGPYAQRAGHDINYAAIAGLLGMTGRPGAPPAIAMNFLADYAGGGLMAAFSIAAALYSRERTGQGQHIDLSMTDGAMSLMTKLAGLYEESGTVPEPGAHRINGLEPYYDVYECSDGEYLAVGPLEPKFFANLCRALGLPELEPLQLQPGERLRVREALQRKFAERSRDEWAAELADVDACVSPVLSLPEALDDPHQRARGMIAEVSHPELGPLRQVGIAPNLSETPGSLRTPPPYPGEHTDRVLEELGFSADEITRLRTERAVG